MQCFSGTGTPVFPSRRCEVTLLSVMQPWKYDCPAPACRNISGLLVGLLTLMLIFRLRFVITAGRAKPYRWQGALAFPQATKAENEVTSYSCKNLSLGRKNVSDARRCI